MAGFSPYLFGFVITCALLLLFRPLAFRIGLVDKPGGRKDHAGEIPLIGGIAMFFGFLLTVTLLETEPLQILPLLVASGLLLVVGTLDDYHDLPAWTRFAAQVAARLLMIFWGGIAIEDLGMLIGTESILLGAWATPFTVFAVVGVINAVNMLDGIDGLAGSLSLLALTLLGFVALTSGQPSIAAPLIILAATTLAFLCFNLRIAGRKHALVFMGDAGSMFMGFVLAWFLVALSQKPANAIAPVTALWLLALPLLDTVSIMLRRILKGRSPFAADREHLHHILLVAGYTVPQSVFIISFIALLLAGIGILGFYTQVPEWMMFNGFLLLFGIYFWGIRHAWKLMRALPHHRTVSRTLQSEGGAEKVRSI